MSTTAESSAALLRTPLHDEHLKLGAKMVPFAGWEMPVQYKGVTEEHKAVREAAGLFDTSHMGELILSGEYAAQVVNYLITNDAGRLTDGQALYTCACNEHGTILDDLIVYRIAQDRWLIVCNASNRAKMAAHFAKAAENHCTFEDASDRMAMIALQGPKALAVAALAGGDGPRLAELPSFHFRDAVLANVRCTVARTGYTGEDGVELFCAPADAPQLFRALVDLGAPLGLQAAGLAARDTLRRGDAGGALALLDQVRAKFPGGMLGQEREALAIEALARSGRKGEAAARADAFVKAYPTSPLTARVQQFAN